MSALHTTAPDSTEAIGFVDRVELRLEFGSSETEAGSIVSFDQHADDRWWRDIVSVLVAMTEPSEQDFMCCPKAFSQDALEGSVETRTTTTRIQVKAVPKMHGMRGRRAIVPETPEPSDD